MKSLLRLATCAAIILASASAQANLAHDYELNNSLADSLGGPSLVDQGGTLNASNYSFGPNQGLSLAGGFANPASYSIEMKFNFATVDSWRKIVDFKNLAPDDGLYDYYSALQFAIIGSPFPTGPNGAFVINQDVNLILTRDGATKQVIGYINGIGNISFTDNTDQAVFSASQAIAHFFIDDAATGGGEASAGVVDFIRIYDSPLTPAQAECLNNGTPQACGIATIPEPGSLALIFLGISAWLASRGRRLNTLSSHSS